MARVGRCLKLRFTKQSQQTKHCSSASTAIFNLTGYDCGMEKSTPHCKLCKLKKLVQTGHVRATISAYNGARELEIHDLAGMCAVVMALDARSFYKSMTTHADHRIWQDVYRTKIKGGREVYLKLTVIDEVLIVSFKEL